MLRLAGTLVIFAVGFVFLTVIFAFKRDDLVDDRD